MINESQLAKALNADRKGVNIKGLARQRDVNKLEKRIEFLEDKLEELDVAVAEGI